MADTLTEVCGYCGKNAPCGCDPSNSGPEQKPVAWMFRSPEDESVVHFFASVHSAPKRAVPLYLHPVAAVPQEDTPCTWTPDEYRTYHTTCGSEWAFDDGDVADNAVKFCHGCGKRVVDINPLPPRDDA